MTANDVEQVAALTSELGYPSNADQISRRLARIVGQPHQMIYVAEDAGMAVAWLHVAVHAYLESDAFAEILGLVVGERHRGRGIGHALVTTAEEWAGANGCRIIRVRSRVSRERAHAFYERGGFRRVKTQHCFEKTNSLLTQLPVTE
jgi:GNAT superfamily N-acetyltransferase